LIFPGLSVIHFLRRLEGLKGKTAILLLHHVNEWDLQFYRLYFREIQVLGNQTARFRGEAIGEYNVYLMPGKEYRGNWQPYITKVKAS
jgi:hypothetical protein